ncbi:MAG: copper amine oxidase N-terminal domain-containing protein [Clostridia bacterium]|nr:copper amine oxidase N-terminal domain-containing protein [Clostridia bacterium]
MKGNIKSFICGMLVMGVISSAAVIAADNWQNINVLPNTIKVVVDGKEVQADNFLYNDTTYLPIRAVSEALKMDVQYDNATSTATISEKKEDDNMAVTSKYTPPAEYINNIDYIVEKDGVYYALLNFIATKIQDAGYKFNYDYDTRTFSALKEGNVIYSNQTILLEDEPFSVIPYDQFVEEIEPLLK